MMIWGIEEGHREDVEEALKTTSAQHIGLALAYLGASASEERGEQCVEWMETYLPEIKFA